MFNTYVGYVRESVGCLCISLTISTIAFYCVTIRNVESVTLPTIRQCALLIVALLKDFGWFS